MSHHVSVAEVTKRFEHRQRGVTAVDSVSFDVGRGEFIAILGPSGCGKSTLLRLISGLDKPTSGCVLIDGKPVPGPGPHVGFVFQQPVLLPWLSAIQNVLLPAQLMGKEPVASVPRAHHLLRMAGLSGWENALAPTLSGGMQQRVSICRALLTSPSVLLMDEPFAAVDALTREDLCVGLLDIWELEQKTILFVTHNITEAVFLADRIVVMSAHPGRITDIISNPLPRPRRPGVEFTAAFSEIAARLRTAVAEGRAVAGRPASVAA